MKPAINPGVTIGYGVVTESDINLDVFGNTQSGSKPIIWEGPLMSQMQAEERSTSTLAESYVVSVSTIKRIRNGSSWRGIK